MIFDNIAITVKPQNGTIILCTYVGPVFYTASLLLGNHMDKSKGTRSIFLLLLDLTYCILFIYIYISVEIIVITNRKTSYRNNRENITINNIIKISHRPTLYVQYYDMYMVDVTSDPSSPSSHPCY